jgi:hypothetical protein
MVRPIQFEANWLVVMLLCTLCKAYLVQQIGPTGRPSPSLSSRERSSRGTEATSGNLPRIGANADGLAEEAFLLNQWLTGAVILVRTLEVVYYQTCSAFPTSTDTV